MYKFIRNLINWLLVAGAMFIGVSAHAAGTWTATGSLSESELTELINLQN